MKKIFLLIFFCSSLCAMNDGRLITPDSSDDPFLLSEKTGNIEVTCTRCKKTTTHRFGESINTESLNLPSDADNPLSGDNATFLCPLPCNYTNHIPIINYIKSLCYPHEKSALTETEETIIYKIRLFETTPKKALKRILSNKTKLKNIDKELKLLEDKYFYVNENQRNITDSTFKFIKKNVLPVYHVKKALEYFNKKIKKKLNQSKTKLFKEKIKNHPCPQPNRGSYSYEDTMINNFLLSHLLSLTATGIYLYMKSQNKKEATIKILGNVAIHFLSTFTLGPLIFNSFLKKCELYRKNLKEQKKTTELENDLKKISTLKNEYLPESFRGMLFTNKEKSGDVIITTAT